MDFNNSSYNNLWLLSDTIHFEWSNLIIFTDKEDKYLVLNNACEVFQIPCFLQDNLV